MQFEPRDQFEQRQKKLEQIQALGYEAFPREYRWTDTPAALVEKYGDMIQIGARNMHNFTLLKRVGRSRLPVLLKRGMAATLEEWLLAAEYVMAEGNYQIVLCERGVRTFAQHTRNTLDLAAVPAVRRISHLPVIVDAAHGTGRSYMVTPLARAGVAVGADGLTLAGPEGGYLRVRGDPATLPYKPGYHRLLDARGATLALTP